MSTSTTDLVNIFLMLGSSVVAFFFPFELFLFSYAVLGPLHYLTEISWLRKKNYFTSSKHDYLILGIPTVLACVASFIGLQAVAAGCLFFAFADALVMVAVRNPHLKIVLYVALAGTGFLLGGSYAFLFFFALLLPTLVHVLFFTGTFVLNGALKSRSVLGYLSLLTFVGCLIALCFVTGDGHALPTYVQNTYKIFETLNLHILQGVGADITNPTFAVYASVAGLALMRVTAFSYTYHYLNWFSKTSVIKWHLVPQSELFIVIALWASSVALYLYNYTLGLGVLLFLSLLHVVLEFPLNHRTLVSIGSEIRNRLKV